MKILIDMNLSPDWREILARHGCEAVHWSSVGKPTAPDKTILQYARDNGYVVLTHDLDFGAILAATGSRSPSVIQIRMQDVLSERFQSLLLNTLRQFESELNAGALVVVDESRSRARVLPIR
jgi:predicted nuclease of predicted toxin-antitoxin system